MLKVSIFIVPINMWSRQVWLNDCIKINQMTANMVAGCCGATASVLLWVGLPGVLDGIKGGANVIVFGLQKTSQPATFICEAHWQHLSQRLY